MKKKTAIITGASRENGLGLNTALKLAELGFHIIPTARKSADVDRVKALLREKNIDGTALQLDICDSKSVSSLTAFIAETFGSLDVLINNAAINLEGAGGESSKLPSETPLSNFRETFEANVLGPIALTQSLLPLLRKSPEPRIVNVSSCLGSLTMHSDPSCWMYNLKLPSYDLSKTALNNWTVELAWELRDTPFKVNSAHPGWVKTDMGGDNAPLEISEGIKTMVELATLPADGPSSGFFHLGERLPW